MSDLARSFAAPPAGSTADSETPVRAASGEATSERPARLEREFDPANRFRSNHNVLPAR